MKVTLVTYGGLAAGVRKRPLVVDATVLSAAAAAELARLVAAVQAGPSASAGTGHARDAQSYRLTVEGPGGPGFTVTQSDTTANPAFEALRRWVEDHAARS